MDSVCLASRGPEGPAPQGWGSEARLAKGRVRKRTGETNTYTQSGKLYKKKEYTEIREDK